jgi:peptidoglycan/LPS O-acetylase OafA/YrhL
MTSATNVPRHLDSIAALRGFAALVVVVHHAFAYGAVDRVQSRGFRFLADAAQYGQLGVPLFFVISGFCIHQQWVDRTVAGGDASIPFLPFWKRRFSRLYPPYLVVLCLGMAMLLVAHLRGVQAASLAAYPSPRGKWLFMDFAAHVTMLHGLHPVFDKGGGNSPLWTLAREEYLYLLYFALLAFRRRTTMVTTTLVTLAVGVGFDLASLAVLGASSPWRPIFASSALTLWIQWTLGALAVEAHRGLVRLPALFTDPRALALWGPLAAIVASRAPLLAPVAWGLAFFTLVNACVSAERRGHWPRGVLSRWLTRVGVFSYSLYLVHHPLRSLASRALGRFADTTEPMRYLLVVIAITVLSYVAARLFFVLVESRFLRKRDPSGVQLARRSAA